jgi:hypothetical protein
VSAVRSLLALRLRHGVVALLALATAVGAAAPLDRARAQPSSLEYAVKAAYLYKVAPFIEWPASAFPGGGGPFSICVQGADPFGAALDQAVAGQRVGVHPITVRRMDAVSADSGCQILYAGGSRRQSVIDALRTVRGAPVLTVTDGERPPAGRGVIHFVLKDGRVRFDIDDQAASENGLSISAKLLSLALSVRTRR